MSKLYPQCLDSDPLHPQVAASILTRQAPDQDDDEEEEEDNRKKSDDDDEDEDNEDGYSE